MEPMGERWFGALQDYIREKQRTSPLPERDTFDLDQEWQCRIIGGALINWLNEIGPGCFQERQMLSLVLGVASDPFVVFTTDVPGRVAAAEILGDRSEKIACLSEADFENWVAQNPDETYRWHIHVWSTFYDPIDKDVLRNAEEAFPIAKDASYWLHREGTLWAPHAGRGVAHLWVWDGEKPKLLKEAFRSCAF